MPTEPLPPELTGRLLIHCLARDEAERRRLARVLHDEVGQSLAMIKLHLAAVARQLGDAAPPRLHECLSLVQQAAQRARELALEARPSLLDDLGLVPALRWCVQHRTAQAGLNVTITADPPEPALPSDLATVCYRVAEEAVDNVVRHARARNLTVEVRVQSGTAEMTIRDDGVGFDVGRLGWGEPRSLLLMRERVRLAGGELVVQSAPGGSEVRVRFACGD